jgi:DNA (cytosine-5)-methyltransferase 1
MRIGSLFTGVGGLDLAVEARVVWCSEIDPYAAHVIKERWPGVPNLGDVTKIKNPAKVDVLCGGFPCQDISLAGQGRGLNGERSGLWREFDRLIGEVEPRVVFVENVAALRKRGLDEVLGNLAERRFNAEWTTLGAVNVGAPHRRARLFLLAYRDRVALRVITRRSERVEAQRRHGKFGHVGEKLANAGEDRREGRCSRHNDHWRDASWGDAYGRDSGVVYPPPPDDAEGWAKWVRDGGPQPGVCRGAYGVADGLDARRRRGRLRCIGNAVAPRQAAAAFLALAHRAADGFDRK